MEIFDKENNRNLFADVCLQFFSARTLSTLRYILNVLTIAISRLSSMLILIVRQSCFFTSLANKSKCKALAKAIALSEMMYPFIGNSNDASALSIMLAIFKSAKLRKRNQVMASK